jgi:hypothetical protein
MSDSSDMDEYGLNLDFFHMARSRSFSRGRIESPDVSAMLRPHQPVKTKSPVSHAECLWAHRNRAATITPEIPAVPAA